MLPGKKNRNSRSSNCWKCIEIANPTTTTLFLYHFKFFTTQQADLFGSCGGGRGACAPRAAPCLQYSTGLLTAQRILRFLKKNYARNCHEHFEKKGITITIRWFQLCKLTSVLLCQFTFGCEDSVLRTLCVPYP